MPIVPRSRLIERLPLSIPRPVAFAATLALVALAGWVRHAAHSALPPGFPFLTFFPAVILVSVMFGAAFGGFAAMLCGLIAWYFFIPPFYSFSLVPGVGPAMLFYFVVVLVDVAIVHWMQRANRTLARERAHSAALAETRQLLFDELQHRVSNNLQVVAGLLAVQRRRIADPQAAAALDEASRRVALIGRISRTLYGAGAGDANLRQLLDALLDEVLAANGRDDVARAVSCEDERRLTNAQALPVALIVAESIANALEHGLASGIGGRIAIDVEDVGREMRIIVCDDGGALPADFTMASATSMGLSIATMLARQLGGSYALTGGAETRATLQFPVA